MAHPPPSSSSTNLPVINNANMNNDNPVCRICHEEDGVLITPCNCNGSLKHVHDRCLMDWIDVTKSYKCDVCKTRYRLPWTLPRVKAMVGEVVRNIATRTVTYYQGLPIVMKKLFKLTWVIFLFFCVLMFMVSVENFVEEYRRMDDTPLGDGVTWTLRNEWHGVDFSFEFQTGKDQSTWLENGKYCRLVGKFSYSYLICCQTTIEPIRINCSTRKKNSYRYPGTTISVHYNTSSPTSLSSKSNNNATTSTINHLN